MIIREAELADVATVNALAARAVRGLHLKAYPERVRELSIRHLYGADIQLIADRSYYVATVENVIVGAGGWSARDALYGARGAADVAGRPLNPASEPARIRAFYVDPNRAGQGIGGRLLVHSEAAARSAGFGEALLTSTLSAVPFYAAHGYESRQRVAAALPEGLALDMVEMRKSLCSEAGRS